MLRLMFLLISLSVAPAMAQPQAITIPAHPGEQAANGPATLNAVLWQPTGRGPHAAIVLMHGCAGMNTRAGQPFPRDTDWARRLSALGYLILQVDSLTPRNEGSLCGQGNDRRNAFCAALATQALARRPSARILPLAKMPCAACRISSRA